MSDISSRAAKLSHDLQRVIDDAEALLRTTAGTADDATRDLRQRVQAGLAAARENLDHLQDATVERARAAARATDGYVRENPWQSVGAAAALGLLVGVLIARR